MTNELPELLKYLKPHERAELDRLLKVKKKGTLLPSQKLARESEADELLFGGKAGGGKSFLLLFVALYDQSNTIVLRKNFPDLERSLILKSKEMYGDIRNYNESKHRWKIRDKYIQFGYLDKANDIYKYQGAEFDAIFWDELTQFKENEYLYLISRLRSPKKGQRKRIIATSNPGGEGNEWVMRRWAAWLDETHPNPAVPGELRWYKRLADDTEVETTADDPDAKSRTYIPGSLEENFYLGDDYRKNLLSLREPYRSQLLYGSWTIGLQDDAYQLIKRAWVKAAMDRWIQRSNPRQLTRIGVDIARGGDDKTVLSRLFVNWFAELEKHPGRETPDGQSVASLLIKALSGTNAVANLDVIGVGASGFDISRGIGLKVNPVNFAERSSARDKSGQFGFVNIRDECWWGFMEALDPASGLEIALPPDPELFGDLIAPRWSMQAGGIKIESKEQIKKRLGRSPDCGDAVVLAWHAGMRQAQVVAGLDLSRPPTAITHQAEAPARRSDAEIAALLNQLQRGADS